MFYHFFIQLSLNDYALIISKICLLLKETDLGEFSYYVAQVNLSNSFETFVLYLFYVCSNKFIKYSSRKLSIRKSLIYFLTVKIS